MPTSVYVIAMYSVTHVGGSYDFRMVLTVLVGLL